MHVETASFDAIGVRNQVTVLDRRALPRALALARADLAALDRACSRFRDDSELVTLNCRGGGRVSALLFDAVEQALDAAEATSGRVDPCVGGALRALGYDADFDVIRRRARPAPERRAVVPSWQAVELDRPTRTIRLADGVELDLGATAKAAAADRIAAAVARVTGVPVLVSLGGDIAVAGEAPAGGWPVLVTDDSRAPEAFGQVVAIRGGGLATSSTSVRRWRRGAGRAHHIVDPSTGLPAVETWRTASVAAPSCLEANVASTAAIVAGRDAPDWLAVRGLAARLVDPAGGVLRTCGWPDGESTQAAV